MKMFKHIPTYSVFQGLKISANSNDTQYSVGVDGNIINGVPDIKWQSIAFIKDVQKIWTHGQLYDCSGGGSDIYVKDVESLIQFPKIDFQDYIIISETEWLKIADSDIFIIYDSYRTIVFNKVYLGASYAVFYGYFQLTNDVDSIIAKATITNNENGEYRLSLSEIPSVTESTVSDWGFTKNAGTITGISANGTSVATSGVANIPAASTSKYGVTKLSSSTSSTSTSLAATASAVKSAYDLANGRQVKLVSGTNIKTINGESILGAGDITIESGGSNNIAIIDCEFDPTLTYQELSYTTENADQFLLDENITTIILNRNYKTSFGEGDIYATDVIVLNRENWCEASVVYPNTFSNHNWTLSDYNGLILIKNSTGTITGVSANGTNIATSGVANIPAASTSAYGVTKLSSATNSNSEVLAATPKAVKAAYDLANSYKGTVTGVKINGTTKNPSSGVVDLGTVITDISGKQDKLVSGTNIATINNNSILGSGNFDLATSAQLRDYQPKLVSGTSIKTINGESILGSGDITISGGGSSSGSAAYPEVNHGTSDTILSLEPNTFHVWDEVESLQLVYRRPTEGIANEYLFQFTSGATATTLMLPDTIKWANDNPPVITENKIYQISILNNLGTFLEFNNAVIKQANAIYAEIGSKVIYSTFPVDSDVTVTFWDSMDDDEYVVVIPKGSSQVTIPIGFGYFTDVTPVEDDKYYYSY